MAGPESTLLPRHPGKGLAWRAAAVGAFVATMTLTAAPALADEADGSPAPTASAPPSASPNPTADEREDAAPTAAPAPSASPTPSTQPSTAPSERPAPVPSPTPEVEPGGDPDAAAPPRPSPSPSAQPSQTASAPPTAERAPSAPADPEGPAPTAALATGASARAIVTPSFEDVSANPDSPEHSEFAAEIAWLATQGITNGWTTASGAREYRPGQAVTRDAMAAFLFRFVGSFAFTGPRVSPFTDVTARSSEFYDEIAWLEDHGIATGWRVDGGREYRPLAPITREAMAAFLHRWAGSPAVKTPATSPFADVSTGSAFYEAIVWLESTGIALGWDANDGHEFRPRAPITRDAMAAFLFRMSDAQIGFGAGPSSGALVRHATLYVYGADTLNIRTGPSTSFPVSRQLSRGAAVIPTGVVSPTGWIELSFSGTRLWASGYYLSGRNGTAVTSVRRLYDNGRIPLADLCPLSWDRAERLLCQAADDLERLNRAFRARYGINIPVNDSYRDYAGQVRAKELYGNLAATPGTSNHGWAAAIDIAGASLPGGYQGAAYLWLRDSLTGYNWVLPTWARPSGSKPEAWHFEYTG
ncbi:S-layer homology domain-containing protein [Demequina sp. NBRC 110053]|uniref:S-layer homology domain-containing protein n=1 Tax=Demequina sp. NBRC 110053 TaxID=1570342 RepID=UPI000A06A46A|nr:S-layer homology domain-containing protein [Demequina sp. NBRC 110053]